MTFCTRAKVFVESSCIWPIVTDGVSSTTHPLVGVHNAIVSFSTICTPALSRTLADPPVVLPEHAIAATTTATASPPQYQAAVSWLVQ